MIIGADIEVRVWIARADLQCGRLLAALVTAGRLAGLEDERSPASCEQVRGGRSILGLYPATDEQTPKDFAAWRKANGR